MLRLIDATEAVIAPVFAASILMQPVEAGLLVLAPAAVIVAGLIGVSRRLWQGES